MRGYKIASFSVVILLVIVIFAGAVAVPAAAQTDTMQYGYNAEHTGDYRPVAGSNTGKKVWIFTTGGSVWSSPAVVNGVVYVWSDLSRNNAWNFYAINASTGASVWSVGIEEVILSSPAVAVASSTWGAMTAVSTPSMLRQEPQVSPASTSSSTLCPLLSDSPFSDLF